MAARFAWVLNLDADLELAAGAGYTPKRATLEAMARFVPGLAASLLGPEDVLAEDANPASSRELIGRAFCPTPRALAILARVGIEPEPHPHVDVLRRVNARAFASGLGPTLPGGEIVTDLEAARAKLATSPPPGLALNDAWRVKRAFGMSGRGQRVIVAGALSDADADFVRGGIDEGHVQIEPNVAIEREYAIHGMLDESGGYRLGVVVEQRCDARGAWLATERLVLQGPEQIELARRLTEEAARVAAALTAAGYFGPFGIDAFTYRHEREVQLQPRSEINARYSMGFAIGFSA